MTNKQKKQFTDWILRYHPESNKVVGTLTLDPLDGDAGFRRYYRLNTIPSLIYNFYNLDPLWRKDENCNRILLLEPEIFNKYPISNKSVDFMLNLAKNH